jgi:ribosomal protein L16 Arg81 hydroxylase
MSTPKLIIDPDRFRQDYERRPFVIHHDLADHPLLALPRLMALARELDPADVELNAGDVPVSMVDERRPDHGLTPEAALDRIRECKTWLGLKKIGQVPRYRALVDSLLDQLQPLIEPMYPRMYGRQGFIFVTSPSSLVPYHMDPEHNFLFQIRGGKTFTIFDKTDRQLLPEEEIERHYSDENRKMVLARELESRGQRIPLRPGDALHVPINAPHYVQNDAEVSISLSVTFRSPAADQRQQVYLLNRRLRALGLTPAPFGASPARDRIKLGAYRAARTARALLRVAGR